MMDKMDIIAADAITEIGRLAGRIEETASEMAQGLHASIFLMVAKDLRETETGLRLWMENLTRDRLGCRDDG